MRSDRDKRTDTEREIDDFLARFETPADELSADINTYLDEKSSSKKAGTQTFAWKKVASPDLKKSAEKSTGSSKASGKQTDARTVIVASGGSDKGIEERTIFKDIPAQASAGVKETPAAKSKDKKSKDNKKKNNKKEKVVDINNGPSPKKPEKKKPAKPAKKNSEKKKNSKAAAAKKAGIMRTLFFKENKDYDPSKGATYELNGRKNIRRCNINSSDQKTFKPGDTLELYYDPKMRIVVEKGPKTSVLVWGILLLAVGAVSGVSLLTVVIPMLAA